MNNKGAGQNDELKCKKKRARDERKEEKERIWSCSLTLRWENSIPGPACCRKLNSSRWSMSVECVCLMACLSVLRLHEALTALSAKTHFLSLHSRLPPPSSPALSFVWAKSKSEREGAIKRERLQCFCLLSLCPQFIRECSWSSAWHRKAC